jgi:NitT/TauT family transport system ATP-binding protein
MDQHKKGRLSVEHVGFFYPGGQDIFRDFSFHAEPGEFVALLGPSGCGKSTLLNLLAGFHAPTRGTVRLDGAPVAPEMPQLGYVFQSPHLFPWLTARENVRFGLRMANDADVPAQRARSATWTSSAWGRRRTSCPTNCRAGCSSGWHSPARWRWNRACC